MQKRLQINTDRTRKALAAARAARTTKPVSAHQSVELHPALLDYVSHC
jgi:hypothetical protein